MKLLYIDLFCGAGGTSTGVEKARLENEQCAKVIACVNHDKNAIASHAANHPDALHFTEDIRTLNLSPLVSHLQKCRAEYPEALIVLWASLECTNFSKAKGGQPRDADSRTLAEHYLKGCIEWHQGGFIFNVTENDSENAGFYAISDLNTDTESDVKILGNIYDNPYLIKEE